MKTYNVTAKRWARGWELHIDRVGVTQSHGLADAEDMVRGYIALERRVEPDSFKVKITPEIDPKLDASVRQARAEVREAAEAQTRAAEHSRMVARRLKERGLSGRDVAAVLGVSPQRVSQLTRVQG